MVSLSTDIPSNEYQGGRKGECMSDPVRMRNKSQETDAKYISAADALASIRSTESSILAKLH
jgi:hypothetical protein